MIVVPAITVLLVAVLAGVWLVKARLKAGERRQNSFPTASFCPTRRVVIRLSSLDGKTESLLLEGERMTLGRSSANNFSYPADNALSRQHVAFEKNAGDWTIRDLASTNGTFVNGIRLVTAHVLRPGDRIVAGRLKMVCSRASEDAVNRRVLSEEEEQAAPEGAAADGRSAA